MSVLLSIARMLGPGTLFHFFSLTRPVGREQECTRNRARGLRFCSRAGLSGNNPPSCRLGRGMLASVVEEEADDQEDDRPDHEGASRAVLSDHAGERWDADHDPARIAMI